VNRRRIEFRYCLSDLCLFRVGFSASQQPLPFDPKAEPLKLPPSPPEFPDGVDVVVCSGVLLPHLLPPFHRDKSGICYIRNQTSNYYIDLSGTFDDYLKEFSSKTRSTLLRKVRNISGTMECRCFRTPDDAVDFHKLAREVAVKTYQEKLFDGAIPASDEFVAKMRALAERDCFRGYTLSSNGRPVSYLYLPIENEVLIYGYLGYDPEYANLSVGTVLLYMALDQLFAERRFRYFDFTNGEGQNKRLFGRASFLRGDVYFFRWGLRNALAVYGHFLMDRLSGALGQTLDVLGLRQRIRKLLRRM
jgi:CelD/BcsL family acetyltransferase involved in cellulose biosynthesis